MSSLWVHVTIKVDCPYETLWFHNVDGWQEIQDKFYLLGPWLEAMWDEPIT